MPPFESKVAIVTGGASGIGRALCLELGRNGAQVVVTDINEVGAREVASAITADGGNAESAQLDVSSAEQVQDLVRDVANRLGRLDYMFNNAGIAILGEARDMELEHWRRTVDVNLMGCIHGCSAAYSIMLEQGFGHIVNMSSSSGLYRYALCSAYSMTKHGIVGLSTALRTEAAALGVKVTVVCPGPVDTNIFKTSTLLRAKETDITEKMIFKPTSSERAAKIILRGVARNKGFIVFPLLIRINWWLYRLHPGSLALLDHISLMAFRRFVRLK